MVSGAFRAFGRLHRVGHRRHLLRLLRARLHRPRLQPLTRGDGPSSCPPRSGGFGRGELWRPVIPFAAGAEGEDAPPPSQWPASSVVTAKLEAWPNALRYSGNDRYQTSMTVALGLRGIGDYPFDTPDPSSGGASVLANGERLVGGGHLSAGCHRRRRRQPGRRPRRFGVERSHASVHRAVAGTHEFGRPVVLAGRWVHPGGHRQRPDPDHRFGPQRGVEPQPRSPSGGQRPSPGRVHHGPPGDRRRWYGCGARWCG